MILLQTVLPDVLAKHWQWTIDHCVDADMMSSRLQGQWMIWTSQWIAPKRGKEEKFFCTFVSLVWVVLEVGTFTGFSAIAWYEGTKQTQAEIVTLDVRSDILIAARQVFKDLGVDNRIKVVEGAAIETCVVGQTQI